VGRKIYETEIGRLARGILDFMPIDRLVTFVQNELGKKDYTYKGQPLTTKQIKDRIISFPYQVEKRRGKFDPTTERFVKTLLFCIERMDSSLTPKISPLVNELKEGIHFRGPNRTKNVPTWITQLLAGEVINANGPDGYGRYRLQRVEDEDESEE